ncbi:MULTISPECIES: lipopolysaccharide biosynthesis protein [Bacillaceae]|uniref:Oligosaccharide flippase family protein n=1 Tax=Evansella alkalicola TaxID=745819 RepID=A0ABS6JWW9_9BACI|nr:MULTISPECIES: oligosaccharide flippase family protein [Bacillaceae]MBU9723086.1 oligosaccharide flippase family protein [Bacillus alkalicola]
MINKLTKLTKKQFVRNVAIVATGAAGAQAITLLFSPIITRIYGPEAFGVLGVFMALVAIVSPIAAMTYPIAIVLPKKDADAKLLIRISIYTSILMAVFIALLLVFYSNHIVLLLQLEDIAPFLYLIPLVIVFTGFLQVTKQWIIRTKQFSVTARVLFLQALFLNSAKVGMGWINPVASVLIIITTIGSAIHALMLIIGIRGSKTSHHEDTEKPSNVMELMKKYRDFPLYRAPQVFLNAISQSLPVLLLASFFGPASAGFYSIGKTVLSIPGQLIGHAIGDVFYPRIAEAANNGHKLTNLVIKATLALCAVGIIPFGIVIIFGPWLFGFVFGMDWVLAGEYARWIALWTFFLFINTPSVKALPVLSAQLFHLNFTVFTIIARVISLAVGYYAFSSDLISVALFGLSGALINLLLILITINKVKNFDKLRGLN